MWQIQCIDLVKVQTTIDEKVNLNNLTRGKEYGTDKDVDGMDSKRSDGIVQFDTDDDEDLFGLDEFLKTAKRAKEGSVYCSSSQ